MPGAANTSCWLTVLDASFFRNHSVPPDMAGLLSVCAGAPGLLPARKNQRQIFTHGTLRRNPVPSKYLCGTDIFSGGYKVLVTDRSSAAR